MQRAAAVCWWVCKLVQTHKLHALPLTALMSSVGSKAPGTSISKHNTLRANGCCLLCFHSSREWNFVWVHEKFQNCKRDMRKSTVR